jgi:PAS domain S-box-containing protein
MLGSLSVPAAGSLLAGVANLYLLGALRRYRGEPGVRWFVGVVACQALMCFAYGIALLVFDPVLREALELPVWLAVNWIGVLYLGFALEYTGRGDLLWTPLFGSFVAFEVLSTLLVFTNPLHEVVWSGFRLDPAFGAATASYVHHPWVFVQWGGLFVMASIGVLVLLDTVISYGPLYRRQAIAVALTVVPPAAAFTAWTFKLGPVPQLNLTPVAFLPHVVLDLYALFRGDMFEFQPTTRRTAERAAINELGTPVVVLDQESRVVTINAAAAERFDAESENAFGRPVADLYEGDEPDPERAEQDLKVRTGGRRRQFKVATTPLSDAADTHVGYTLVFQDVTAERQRKQRLDVLNRVLRHNLRNDMSVVAGHADALGSELSSPAADRATAIHEVATELVELGEKARQAAETVDADRPVEELQLGPLLADAAADIRRDHPDAVVEVSVPEDLRLASDPTLLEMSFANLIENGVVHADDPAPRVEVTATGRHREDRSVELVVRDDGPGIPDHEVETVAAGEETALEHGSGLGLWLVTWSVTSLGGDLSFETPADGGTTVRVRLPGVRSGD